MIYLKADDFALESCSGRELGIRSGRCESQGLAGRQNQFHVAKVGASASDEMSPPPFGPGSNSAVGLCQLCPTNSSTGSL
jgi:hypothetical protein